MNQWAFVLVAYGVTALATAGLVLWSYLAMRDAESSADSVKRRQ